MKAAASAGKILEPVRIRSIRKTYGALTALDDVSLDVDGGEFVSLLGPSGSGKSTLLMIIAGFIRPDHGSILVNGEEFVTLPAHKRDLGVVFQSYALFPHMTVAENVAFPLRYRKVSRGDMEPLVSRALEMVRLGPLGDRRINQLSGGQRQRVALARALVFSPRLLLMDEPLSALDKNLREEMQVELRRLHRAVGITALYVTHDQREALTLSDRIAVMHQGRIVQVGAPDAVYERPDSVFVARFMGDSQVIPVTRSGDMEVALGQARLSPRSLPSDPAASLVLLLRPEKLEILPFGSLEGPANRLHGRIEELFYQGEQTLVAVRLTDGPLVMARHGGRVRPFGASPGQAVTLGLHPDDTIILDAGLAT